MRRLSLLQSICLLFAYMLPAYRADEALATEAPSRPWPYMAFVYYTDDTIQDLGGARFIRGAVLLTTEYLLVSSIDRANNTEGFPEKTLVARAGAITVDRTFTLNEDENEQDREVIKVYRSSNDSESWWSADLQLVRVVTAFDLTPAVKIAPNLTSLHDVAGEHKQCALLFYDKRFKNDSNDRLLTEANMDLLPAHKCPENDSLTICVGPPKSTSDHDYCLGNTGGPVMCAEHLAAMHSIYTEGCNVPHIYKTLDTWIVFINCAIDDNCNATECNEVCVAETKDPAESTTLRAETKTIEVVDEVQLYRANSSANGTVHQQSLSSNDTRALAMNNTATLNGTGMTEGKVRLSSKKGVHLRSNAAVATLRDPSGIIYFIVSCLPGIRRLH